MAENTHLVEECLESLWDRCETVSNNGTHELGTLPIPGGGFLVMSRQPGELIAWLMNLAGECRPAKLGHLRRILEVV